MNRIVLKLTLMVLIGFAPALAQDNAKSVNEYQDNEAIKFKFNYGFIERAFYIYKVTVDTKIHRKYQDSTTQDFSRKKDVYISLRNPTALQDGFAMVNTSIDSINYEFTDGKQKIRWNSQADDMELPVGQPDFDEIFAITGRYFTSHISPYYEVARIDGELLERGREEASEIPDSVLRQIWINAISDNNLKLYTDPNKNVIRNGRFDKDSTWQMKFAIPIEGITYTCDTAAATFYLFDSKNFHIKAVMPYMYPSQETAAVTGMDRVLLGVDSTSNTKGFWDISVSPRGMLNSAEGEFTTNAYRNYKEIKFKDEIITNIKFNLERTVKWAD